jgi:hypothetical protein
MERRRPSIVGPLVLITVGILFLLANLGALPLSFWEIAARFWPLLLILIGLEIIIGRQSALGAIIILVLWIALVAGVIGLSFAQGNGFLATATTVSDQLAQPLGDIKSATVELNGGIATTFVSALNADSANLMQGTFRHAQGSQITKTYDVMGNEGRLGLREQGTPGVFFGGGSSRWELGLNPQIPIVLHVKGSVGRVNLDLVTLNITSLTIDAGVGNMDIITPQAAVTTMRVNGGVGSTTITIPQGVAARIRVSSGLGGIRVDDLRFPKFGDVYQSADYASATNRIEIEVDGGVGSINVR